MIDTKTRPILLFVTSLLIVFSYQLILPSKVSANPENMAFPIIGASNYSDTYYAGRASGVHHAIDIFAAKHSSVVAVKDGKVTYAPNPQPSWGWEIEITDDDGFTYLYIHLNNDRPGTDDGNGGAMNAYAPDMKEGNRVYRGQHIGYVGDSGNAETTPPHVHFEIIKPGYGNSYPPPIEGFVNPFIYLNNAQRLGAAAEYPALSGELLPYGGRVSAGPSLARGKLGGGSSEQLIVGAGSNGGPHVRVYDENYNYMDKEFMAYNPFFEGGIDVASGDVDGDGKDEIITGAGKGGGPHVRVFDISGSIKSEFFAYDSKFAGGIKVASGDVTGDGKDEIITGILGQGGPHVKIFKQDGTVLGEFFAYDPLFVGGVDVTTGDTDSTGKAKIITGAGPGGGPHVRVFDYSGQAKSGFFAYDSKFTGGVRVSSGNIISSDTNDEIVTMPWSMGGPHLKIFSPDGSLRKQRYTIENWWEGNYDIAASKNQVVYGTGHNRRTSVRAYSY